MDREVLQYLETHPGSTALAVAAGIRTRRASIERWLRCFDGVLVERSLITGELTWMLNEAGERRLSALGGATAGRR
jgi:hypothetical protein